MTFSRWRTFVRLSSVVGIIFLISVIAAFVTGFAVVGIALGVLSITALFLAAIWQENALLLRLELVTPLSASLRVQIETMERLLQSQLGGQTPPSVHVSANPGNGLEIFRSLGSPGVIVVHLGLMADLTDAQWLGISAEACRNLNAPGSVLRSLCLWARLWLVPFLPGPWLAWAQKGTAPPTKAFDQATPATALWFLALWPLLRFLNWLDDSTPRLSPFQPRGYNSGHVQA